jgi:hypothetical protein
MPLVPARHLHDTVFERLGDPVLDGPAARQMPEDW